MAEFRVMLVFSLVLGAYSGLLGGWRDLENLSSYQQDLKDRIKDQLMQSSNGNNANKTRVISSHVESQIVAGTNYKFTYTIGSTECKTSDPKPVEDCEILQVQECEVTLFVSLDNTEHINKRGCSPYQSYVQTDKQMNKHQENKLFSKQGANMLFKKRQPVRHARSVGAPSGVQIGDADVLAAVDYLMEDLNSKSNSMYRTMAYDIVDATKQVVAGIKFTMTLKMGVSTKCKNNPANKHASLDNCPLEHTSRRDSCYVEILYQAWMPKNQQYRQIAFSCKGDKKHSSNAVNSDSHMSQSPHKTPLIGGDDHDVGNYGSFMEFKQTFNKQYADDNEEVQRFRIFKENMKKVQELKKKEQGSARYGATEFADLTEDEFKASRTSGKWDLSENKWLQQATIPKLAVPAAFDWRNHSAVSEVKNQGSCGSCWAFSVTGNIEGQWAINKKQLLSLSEQELVDCDKVDQGCDGGLPTNAYREIIRLGGLETEKEYPYEGEDDKCTFNKAEVDAKITGAVNISSNETEMAQWLVKNGPISIGINAAMMQFYFGGVSHPWSIFCDPDSLDHGVLIVGFGVEKGWFSDVPYWIIKNSWGASWGEKGYYLVYRGDGTCGLNKMPTSAIVSK